MSLNETKRPLVKAPMTATVRQNIGRTAVGSLQSPGVLGGENPFRWRRRIFRETAPQEMRAAFNGRHHPMEKADRLRYWLPLIEISLFSAPNRFVPQPPAGRVCRGSSRGFVGCRDCNNDNYTTNNNNNEGGLTACAVRSVAFDLSVFGS